MDLIATYQNGSQMIVEGFGKETILGAVKDVLDGNYTAAPNGQKVVSFKVRFTDEELPVWPAD